MDRIGKYYTISQNDMSDRLRWLRKIRFFAGLSMFVFFGYLRIVDWLDFPFFLFALAPLFEMYVNQPYEWVIKRTKNHRFLIFVSQLLDVLAVTWGIYFVGGIDMLSAPLAYPLIFIFTAMALSPLRTFIMANICFLSFSCMYYLEDHGIIPAIAPFQIELTHEARMVFVVLIGIMYNIIAFGVVYLAGMLRKRETELEERIRELNCFYELSRITEKNRGSEEKVMQEIVYFIPPAWKYPKFACARIFFKGKEFKTDNFMETKWRQAEYISVQGSKVGVIEVYYTRSLPENDEGPFLWEERMLLESMAERLGKISERVQAQKELQEYSLELQRSNKDLNDFAYIISHDLKEPLRNIAAFSRFAAEDCAPQMDEKGKRNLDRIRANVTRMESLIENLLELSRLERQKNPFEVAKINEVLREALLRCEYSIEISKAEVEIASGMPVVFCDRVRMTEVFANLVSNSIKFRGELPPRIEIGWKDKGPFYEFYVKDNGQGIEKSDLDRIFDMFIRVGTEKEQRGSGVGLTIVKRIVEMHGGKIWLESEIGKGTTFYFTIAKSENKEA